MKRFASLLIFTICFLCGVIFAAQETNTNDLIELNRIKPSQIVSNQKQEVQENNLDKIIEY